MTAQGSSSYCLMSASSRSRLPLKAYGTSLRNTRETLGLSLQALADILDVSPQAVHQFEKGETAGTISLRQLDKVARAMGWQLSYTLRPRGPKPRRHRAEPEAAPLAPAARPASSGESEPSYMPVDQSMLLANQAEGRFD